MHSNILRNIFWIHEIVSKIMHLKILFDKCVFASFLSGSPPADLDAVWLPTSLPVAYFEEGLVKHVS